MYRNRKDYDKIAQIVIDIFLDYGLKTFPINEKELCKKLGIVLIPYSELNYDDLIIAKKKSKEAFYSSATRKSKPMIFYNDNLLEIISEGRMRYSIFHEIKHYVCNDTDDSEFNEDMAEYFGHYMPAPIPVLIVKNITSPLEIVDYCGLSYQAACYVSNNIKNRAKKYGNHIFNYEKPLIRHLFGDDYFERSDAYECL